MAESGPALTPEPESFKGFIVHGYADLRRDRLYFIGRLEDGRSFAAAEFRWRPSFYIYQSQGEKCAALFRSRGLEDRFRILPSEMRAFSGAELLRICFDRYEDRTLGLRLLEQEGIPGPGESIKPPELFLQERFIRGLTLISGPSYPGRRVDLIFPNPDLRSPETAFAVPLNIASIDIETDMSSGAVLAAALAWAVSGTDGELKSRDRLVRVLAPKRKGPECRDDRALFFHDDEASLLKALIEDIRRVDPDVLTGWNFLDFDFPRLAERCARLRVPFLLGRAPEEAKYFPGGPASSDEDAHWRRGRSAAALVPGRQVIDALRVVRSGPRRFPSYTLESVARAVLGEGKLVNSSGQDKVRELEKLYQEDKTAFGRYCLKDADLVLKILASTGLFALTLERARLTGVSLDKAWTSVVSFERIYGMELRRRGIVPPPENPGHRVSGAAGGTVLDPMPGFFRNVAVFDFRSLYPSIMRTFNIDPLSHERAGKAQPSTPPVEAPNGALFAREAGILPELITEYFAARHKALDMGNETASHVYKILMNSFYGVLGTSACRYGRTELAGAITSFARKWLLFSRDWFNRKAFPVLYGDTDSLFVETGFNDNASYEDFIKWGQSQTQKLNSFLAETIQAEYGVESFLELRFEKPYRRFMIPPLRGPYGRSGAGEEKGSRGRAKGYGGWLLDPAGNLTVEIKGMEAVRSDATPLAKRIQIELLELVFQGACEEEFRRKVLETLKDLRQGKLDGELVYRKRLSRAPETYTASTPPQVKAARALGWKNRRGAVEYLWALTGPEPVSLPHGPLDYDHYADSQVLPVALSIAAAAGWTGELFPRKGRDRDALESGQMELDW